MFLVLTDKDGDPVIFNVDHIIKIQVGADVHQHSVVATFAREIGKNGQSITTHTLVKESVSEIAAFLKGLER